jgi:hypothetical protein
VSKVQWLLNTKMLAGVVMGWMITTGLSQLIETVNRHGSDYGGVMMIGLGIAGWCVFAYVFRER